MTQQPDQQNPEQAQQQPTPPGAEAGYQPPQAGHQPPQAGYQQAQYQPSQPGYGAAALPLSPDQERNWATLAHVIPLVAMVLSAGTLGFVGSLVIYLLYKDRGPFVRQHAANSLNIQIITGIVLLISIPFMLVLVGFLTFGLALLFAFVVHIIAAMKANNGEWYRPPFTPQFVS
jgi:uncharacterized Tic20 family protein